jgi:ABC-type dipeptide/oligopeptide/nickel transport system permease component
MQQIKTNFGFKTISIGSITVYTGKIRIQVQPSNLASKLQNYAEHLTFRESVSKSSYKTYTTVSFETTSYTLNKDLMRAIMLVMKDIAQARLDFKYSVYTEQPVTTEILEDLIMPF